MVLHLYSALLAVIRLNVNLNPQYDYLVSLESSGYREFHGINPQIIPNITTPGPGTFSCQSSQHFLPRIATAKTELPDLTKKRQFCAFSAFFKFVQPFCHNDFLELWKGFHILCPILPLNSPCSGRNFKTKQCTFGLISSSYSRSQPGVPY